jgi:glutathione peroxidase
MCCTPTSQLSTIKQPRNNYQNVTFISHVIKVDVNGEDAAPIYKFLKSTKTGPFGDDIKWNFAKFLVDKQGRVAERYGPTTYPLSIQVIKFLAVQIGVLCSSSLLDHPIVLQQYLSRVSACRRT